MTRPPITSGRLCDGRVCVVTGGGRGIGREYALMLAEHGAHVVVNDLGSDRAGGGADTGPAQQVADEITRPAEPRWPTPTTSPPGRARRRSWIRRSTSSAVSTP